MAIYLYHCEKCGETVDVLQRDPEKAPVCCGSSTSYVFAPIAMVKMKGMGGFPSRVKEFKGTAPFT